LTRPAGNVLRVDLIFEEFHGLNKGRFCSDHDHVYGVEILLAIETSGEVGFWVNGGMEFFAQRAPKSEKIVNGAGLHVQKICYDRVNVDFVPEHPEKIRRKISFCHDDTWHFGH